MQVAPLPDNEEQRIERLRRYQILDTLPEEAFDRITRMVAEIIETPIALVSLVDTERQWFKSKYGLGASETPRDLAFCAHAILQDGIFEVEDATKDFRFADNPLVTQDPSIRFYAGAPLRTAGGLNIGTLCAVDQKTRRLTDKQRLLLSDLAGIVVDELELRIALRGALHEAAQEVKKRAIESEFLSLVTHELRTPLTSIRGSLGLLNGPAAENLPKMAADLIVIAHRNVESLLRIINDLLDVQKFESGNLNLDFDVVDAQELVRRTCQDMEGLASPKRVTIRVEHPDKATLVGDAGRLRQVLTNLISNAIKFSHESAEVVVAAGINGAYLRISVTDKGPGIPEKFRAHIFKKFSQASGENKTKGTGLGLAICKAIVEAHQGIIGFTSSIGEGTTFNVDLPLRQTVLGPLDDQGRSSDGQPTAQAMAASSGR